MAAAPSRPLLGLFFIVLSFALWGGALASPFVEAPLSTRAGMGIGFYGVSYLAFGVGCKLCGEAMWPAVKGWVGRRLGRRGQLDQDGLR